MKKAEFIDQLANDPRLGSKKAATAAVEAVLDGISTALTRGEDVGFTGFGKFSVSMRNPRKGGVEGALLQPRGGAGGAGELGSTTNRSPLRPSSASGEGAAFVSVRKTGAAVVALGRALRKPPNDPNSNAAPPGAACCGSAPRCRSARASCPPLLHRDH